MRWMTLPMTWLLATTVGATQPGGNGANDVFARLQAQVERDGTPRERALVAQLAKGLRDPEVRARGSQRLRDAASAAPSDPLVQWLWATTPLEATGCPGDASCADRTMAAARLDPDNAAAWGPVLEAAWKAGDAEAAGEALDHAAKASHYAEPFAEAIGAWRELLRRYPMPDASYAQSPYSNGRPVSREEGNAIAAVAFASAMVSPTQGFFRSCDAKVAEPPSAEDLARCLRVAGLMQASPTVVQRMMGSGLQHRAGGPEGPGFRRQQLWWSTIWPAMENDSREAMRYFEDLESTGSEVQAIELALQRAGKPLAPPVDWVYVSPFANAPAPPGRPAKP